METPITPVLAVDLDGTLLRTDTLLESLCVLARERPLALVGAALALTKGRAHFKAWVAGRAPLDTDSLPLNTELLRWLEDQTAEGRHLILVTAAERRIANAIADRTGLFAGVLATEDGHNLKGKAKAARLMEVYGRGGYDYVGDARADIPVWAGARRAIVVGDSRLVAAARQVADIERVFPTSTGSWAGALRALRPHQWVKNLLIFLPILAAHRLDEGASLAAAFLAFLAFSLTASAVYLLNDLLDLPDDRRHPRKCQRPFAAGDLPLLWGLILIPVLLAGGAFLCLPLPPVFAAVLGCYFVLTCAYSLYLKRLPIVDVMTLAGLYTVRVIAGSAAVAMLTSFWLLALSMFLFLSLALVKRYTELQGLLDRGELTASGRGWHVDDLPLIQTLGVAAGLACVLVLALYIDSAPAQRLYATPEALWFLCPLVLYWISRLWFKTHRGEMHDDPVVFALSDRISLILFSLAATILYFATLGLNP